MSEHTDDAHDPQRHPELLVWLAERQAAFEHWARTNGGAERWDFGPASLEPLEELVRERFGTLEDVFGVRRGEFVQGAVWYLGETVRRARGLVWKYEPMILDETAPAPRLFAPVHQNGTVDTPCVSPAGADESAGQYPLNMLSRLLMKHDEIGTPLEYHLVEALEEPDDDFEDFEGDEDHEDDEDSA
ncbi:hypothetical protein [Streptomyces sp. NPDC001165]|uniref:hypothetical protein n=1 Tax=Streptomyces sp. NPDC001165 TaxID=3364546 RepID=UPI0036C84143